jgi:arylsulfatase A-like enzyme
LNPERWITPELQAGTTPLVKLMGGKATRDFTNYRHPALSEADYLGPRAIIEGQHKLVIHEAKQGAAKVELFDLESDPAEKKNLLAEKPDLAAKLQKHLREWQRSVLQSLTGADYRK